MGSIKSKPDMNEDILVLIDFSENSEELLRYGISMAKLNGANIRLFHVANDNSIDSTENQISALQSINMTDTELQNKLEAYATLVRAEGIEVSYSFTFGDRRNEISNQIESTLPSLVLIGRSMRTKLTLNRLLGRSSIAQSISEKVSTPILSLGKKN